MVGEIGCLSINPGEAHRFLRCNRSWKISQVILGRNQPRYDSMLEMAKVEFEYFREKLGVLQIEVPSKGN